MTLRRFGLLGLSLSLTLGASLTWPRPAAAWDPSTTHQGLLEAAVRRSAMHLRWMDASELERGLFSALRVDPSLLDADELRLLKQAVAGAHADTGAVPLGGPGACPPADAPPETQLYCVDEDLWEHSALGWMRLGMIAEVTPTARQLHHFISLEQPEALTWKDDELPASLLRSRQARSNGEPLAGVVTGTNFSGEAASATAWLADAKDLLAPARTYMHLRKASYAETRAERDHHLALALIGVGALLHVMQDLSVPAHARADATAFFAQLSPAPGDRGLPLQEFVRFEYGREDLPGIVAPSEPPTGEPLAESLLAHLFGSGAHEGLATLAAGHFFSEASVPAPRHLDAELGAAEAAALLLGDDHHLEPAEVDGAVLSPWPATEGYLLSPMGRALAAFDTDAEGRIRPYVDEVCYRDQANLLLPAAVDTSRSILDLLWPAWPQMQHGGDTLTLTLPAWDTAKLTITVEDEHGRRRQLASHPLNVAAETTIPLAIGELASGERVVLLLEASRTDGPLIMLEQVLGQPGEAAPVTLTPTPTVEPEPEPETTEPEPETTEPETTEPETTEPEATPDDASAPAAAPTPNPAAPAPK